MSDKWSDLIIGNVLTIPFADCLEIKSFKIRNDEIVVYPVKGRKFILSNTEKNVEILTKKTLEYLTDCDFSIYEYKVMEDGRNLKCKSMKKPSVILPNTREIRNFVSADVENHYFKMAEKIGTHSFREVRDYIKNWVLIFKPPFIVPSLSVLGIISFLVTQINPLLGIPFIAGFITSATYLAKKSIKESSEKLRLDKYRKNHTFPFMQEMTPEDILNEKINNNKELNNSIFVTLKDILGLNQEQFDKFMNFLGIDFIMDVNALVQLNDRQLYILRDSLERMKKYDMYQIDPRLSSEIIELLEPSDMNLKKIEQGHGEHETFIDISVEQSFRLRYFSR